MWAICWLHSAMICLQPNIILPKLEMQYTGLRVIRCVKWVYLNSMGKGGKHRSNPTFHFPFPPSPFPTRALGLKTHLEDGFENIDDVLCPCASPLPPFPRVECQWFFYLSEEYPGSEHTQDNSSLQGIRSIRPMFTPIWTFFLAMCPGLTFSVTHDCCFFWCGRGRGRRLPLPPFILVYNIGCYYRYDRNGFHGGAHTYKISHG